MKKICLNTDLVNINSRYIYEGNFKDSFTEEDNFDENWLISFDVEINLDLLSKDDMIGKIFLPVGFANALTDFKVKLIKIPYNENDDASDIVNKFNSSLSTDIVDVLEVSKDSTYFEFDLSNVEFENKSNNSSKLIARFIITNDYEVEDSNLTEKFIIYQPIAFTNENNLTISILKLELLDKKATTNIYSFSNDLLVNLVSREVIYNNVIYGETKNDNPLSISLSYIKGSGITHNFMMKSDENLYKLKTSNYVIKNPYEYTSITCANGLKKYFYFINYESNKDFFDAHQIDQTALVGYCFDTGEFIKYSSSSSRYIIEDSNYNKIIFTVYGNNMIKVVSLVTKDNDQISFTYNNSNQLTKIRDIEFTYNTLNKLTKIEFTNESRYVEISEPSDVGYSTIRLYDSREETNDTLLKDIRLEYDTEGLLSTIYDYIVRTKTLISYTNDSVNNIKLFYQNSSDVYDENRSEVFVYSSDYTEIVNVKNNTNVTYFYNKDKKPVEVLESTGDRISYTYVNDFKVGERRELKENQEIVFNSMFNNDLTGWEYSGNVSLNEHTKEENKYIKMSSGQNIHQMLIPSPGNEYRIKALVKHQQSSGPINSVIVGEGSYQVFRDGSTKTIIYTLVATFDNEKSSWYEITSDKVSIPSDAYSCNLALNVFCEHEVYIDSISVLDDTKVDSNIVRNNSFAFDFEYWTVGTNAPLLLDSGIDGKCVSLKANSQLSQSIRFRNNEKYCLSGFIKHGVSNNIQTEVMAVGSYKINNQLDDSLDVETETIPIVLTAVLDKTHNDWYRFKSNEIFIPSNAIDAKATITINAKEDIIIDSIKLTNENRKNYNLYPNGKMKYIESFDDGQMSITDIYTVNNPSKVSFDYFEDTLDHPNYLNNRVIKISDSMDSEVTLSKEFELVGYTDEVYSVGVLFKGLLNNKMNCTLFVRTLKGNSFNSELDYDEYLFTASPYINIFQKIGGSFKVKNDFTRIMIGVKYLGNTSIYLDAFELYKNESAVKIAYDEMGRLLETSNSSNSMSYIYDNTNKLSNSVSNNGIYKRYKYDNNYLVEEEDLFKNKKSYEYDLAGRCDKVTINYGTENSYSTSIDYSTGVFTNEFGINFTNKLNEYNLLCEQIYPNNLEIDYYYDNKDRITKVTTTNASDITYQYIEKNIASLDIKESVKVINSSNTCVFDYSYTGLIKNITYNDVLIESYNYNNQRQLIERMVNNHTYKYEYDEHNRISNILLLNNETNEYDNQYEFKYDFNNNICELINYPDNVIIYYEYDDKNRLIKKYSKDYKEVIKYSYNLNNTIKTKYHSLLYDKKELNYVYLKDEENYSKEEYISDLIINYNSDIILGNDYNKGLYGLSSIDIDIDYLYDDDINMNVTNFTKNTQVLTYDLSDVNTLKDGCIINNVPFNYNEWVTSNENVFSVSLWFKPGSEIQKTILVHLYDASANDDISDYKVYIDTDGKIKIKNNGNVLIETSSVVVSNTWNFICLSIDSETGLMLKHNNNSINTINTYSNSLTTSFNHMEIGKTIFDDSNDGSLDVDTSNINRVMPLRLALVSVDRINHTEETTTSIYEKGLKYFINGKNTKYSSVKLNTEINRIEYKKVFDKLGKLKKKEYIVNDEVKYEKTYEYDKTRVISEQHGNSIINYQYDNMNNVIRKEVNNIATDYTYDLYGRIYQITKNNRLETYIYNQQGNISRILTTDVDSLNVQTTIDRNFTYDTVHKDRLEKVTKKVGQGNTVNEYVLTYSNANPFYPSSINSTSLIWDKGRLIQYGTNIYEYDVDGRRIGKTVGTTKYTYKYEDNKLVKEGISDTTNGIYVTLDFIYNQDNELIGVYNNHKTYYYDKNVIGEIIGIVDESGNYVVKYEYTTYGTVDKTITSTNDVSLYNPFVYKGYYYDDETELYWVSSRYYSPELCRWISPDSIEYLDHQSINGLNLYCYCYNNPISYYDPSGNVAIPTLLIISAIIIVVFALAATANDIYQIESGNVYVDMNKTNSENVHIENSYKILTPWMRYGYSFHLNHFTPNTKDVIQGSTAGVQFEWELHNYAAWLGIGGDSAKHLDVGKSIFADGKTHPLRDEHGNITTTGLMSLGMRIVYICLGNPIYWIWDLIVNGGF